MKTFWLVMCIFIFYQEPIAGVLAFSGTRIKRSVATDANSCDDWEVYDGTACVCADSQTSRCTDKGGVVCDDEGNKYRSICHFALDICSGEKDPDRKVVTCGLCNSLRLVDESQPSPEHEYFMLEGQAEGLSAVYRSSRQDGLSVFFEDSLQKWVVGYINGSSKSIAMVQDLYAENPQDNEGGMLVSTPTGNKTTWIEKPSIMLECYNESFSVNTTISRRPKRFLFSLIIGLIVASVTVSATVTTLNVIQAKRGCLYYPSVCRLRDRLKNQLGPEVRRLRNNFRSQYGDISNYKRSVESVVDVVMDIKDSLITIRELQTNLNASLSQVIAKLGDIPERLPELGDALKDYEDWLKGVHLGVAFNSISFYVEVTLLPLLTASASLFSLASAGLGSLAGLTFSVVEFVNSIRRERKVKADLRRAESEYLKAKSELNNAFYKMREFQKKFCKTTIRFLYTLSDKGRAYHPMFRNLYYFIKGKYQYVPAYCYISHIYTQSNTGTLWQLKNSYLSPLLHYLRNSESDLRQRIRDVKEMDQFMNQIDLKVRDEKKEPSELFSLITKIKPKLAQKKFGTLYAVLLYIATKSLPKESCYWGWNLALFRSNSVNENNYRKSPVCNSSEITSLTDKIQQKVSESEIPCRIARLVKGNIFRSKYSVIRYIADHVLPIAKCYWGYNLEDVRQSRYNNDIEGAQMSSALFSTLGFLAHVGRNDSMVKLARMMICVVNRVCNRDWQNFLMCTVWKNKGVGQVISCPTLNTGNQCIPSVSSHQSCKQIN